MTARARGFDDEDLLHQLGWVRRLAVELVREPAAADDVTQEVARVALEKRAQFQGDERGLRAWLSAVARRLAADRRHSDRARLARERSVARPERDESLPSVAERSARARVVADAVQSLAEPYRTTVLHRYFDELSMTDVAERTGVDEATVRKRLSRAREMLRARLERGGGRDDPAWLAAIAGTGFDRTPQFTAGTSATAAAAVGVGAMTTKLVAGTALCAVIAACILLWPEDRSARGPDVTSAVAEAPAVLERPQVSVISPLPEASVSRSSASNPPSAGPSEEPAPAHDGPTLRIRVVDVDERAVVSGVLSVESDRLPFRAFSNTRVPGTVPIAGAVTIVPLPGGTRSVLLAASTPALLPSRWLEVMAIEGAEVRDLTLVVGAPLASPALSGRILVDGVQRVPAGLSICVLGETSAVSYGLVHASERTWATERVPESAHLMITSAETVVARIELTQDRLTGGVLDLELATGRSLALRLLDRATGRPHAGASFMLHTSTDTGDHWDHALRLLRTDEHGTCRTTGIPVFGSVSIGPDLDPVARIRVQNQATEPRPTQWMGEPWYSHRLAENDPQVLEVELRVDIPRSGGSAYGFLSPEMLAPVRERTARIVSAEVTAAVPSGGGKLEVPHDDTGRWTLESHWPSSHLVWIQDAQTSRQLTEKVAVLLDGPHAIGPIELPPFDGLDVELDVRGIPEGASLSVFVEGEGDERRTETPTVQAGACQHRLALAKPAFLSVTWTVARGDDAQSQWRTQRMHVDPAATRTVVVDFAAGSSHQIVFAPQGEPLLADTRLSLARWLPGAEFPADVLRLSPTPDQPGATVALAPGRWHWTCRAWPSNLVAMGVVEVDAVASEIVIAPRIVRRPRVDAVKGIVLEEADGVDLRPIPIGYRSQRFEAAGDFLVREGMRWTELP